MKTLLNVKVTLRKAAKGNKTQVETAYNPDSFEFPLKIIARSYNGKSRGLIGYISRQGDLKLVRTMRGFSKIDQQSLFKINFILELISSNKNTPNLVGKDTILLEKKENKFKEYQTPILSRLSNLKNPK